MFKLKYNKFLKWEYNEYADKYILMHMHTNEYIYEYTNENKYEWLDEWMNCLHRSYVLEMKDCDSFSTRVGRKNRSDGVLNTHTGVCCTLQVYAVHAQVFSVHYRWIL